MLEAKLLPVTDNARNMVKAFSLYPVEHYNEDEDDEFDDDDSDILPLDVSTKYDYSYNNPWD